MPVVNLAARGGSLLSSRASSTYKGIRKAEFQKIGRIKSGTFIRSAFLGSQILWILVRLSMSSRRLPGSLMVVAASCIADSHAAGCPFGSTSMLPWWIYRQ